MRRLTLRDIEQQFPARLDSHAIVDGAPITGFSVDSRSIQPGQLFFALKGARVDSHTFLADVAAAGAIGAIVSTTYQGPNYGLVLFPVDDVLDALQNLARHCLSLDRSIIVAITGSVGKTTTKEFIGRFLAQRYKTAVSPGNNNSQVGLPLAVLNHTTGQEEVLVFEMGMTQPTQISRLISIAPPDVALITSVALVHAGNFEGLEAIARAKAEIFGSSKTSVGLLPREIINFGALCQIGSCRKRSFSTITQDADYYLTEKEGCLVVETAGQTQRLGSWSIPGAHNQHNLLSAIAVARELKVSWEEIAMVVPQLTLPERRFQRIEKGGVTFINDSYNAPPIAVKAALSMLPEPSNGRCRIAILGPMPELGQFSVACHREIGQYALTKVDEMYCLGEECHPIYEVWQSAGRPVNWFFKREELLEAMRNRIKPGDVVLIKGTNVFQMWRLVEEWA